MARTVTLQPQAVTITSAKVGSVVTSQRYDPTLSTTLVNGSAETFAEWTSSYYFTDSTTGQTFYIHQINDDLVTKYS